MKTFFLLFCSALFIIAGFRPLVKATVLGNVIDAQTKEPLVGAMVKITKDHVLITGRATNKEGKYILSLEPGNMI